MKTTLCAHLFPHHVAGIPHSAVEVGPSDGKGNLRRGEPRLLQGLKESTLCGCLAYFPSSFHSHPVPLHVVLGDSPAVERSHERGEDAKGGAEVQVNHVGLNCEE